MKVLVGGGGMMGLAGAISLAQKGHTVVLLDIGMPPCPFASSFDSSRAVRADYGRMYLSLFSSFFLSLSSALLPPCPPQYSLPLSPSPFFFPPPFPPFPPFFPLSSPYLPPIFSPSLFSIIIPFFLIFVPDDQFLTSLSLKAIEKWEEWEREALREATGPMYHSTGVLLLSSQPLSAPSYEGDSFRTLSSLGVRDLCPFSPDSFSSQGHLI